MTGLFHDEAREELDQAVAWYERQRTGLGLEFLEEVRRVVAQIIIHPRRFPMTMEGAYRTSTRRFPYSIIYVPREANLVILAVMHQSRRPGYWKHRMD
jgi:toxin ParE1/3/4